MDWAQGIQVRQKWHIITSDEIAQIRKLLTEIEQDGAEHSRANAQELGHLITLIERRLV